MKDCWTSPHSQAIQDIDEFVSSSDLEKWVKYIVNAVNVSRLVNKTQEQKCLVTLYFDGPFWTFCLH